MSQNKALDCLVLPSSSVSYPRTPTSAPVFTFTALAASSQRDYSRQEALLETQHRNMDAWMKAGPLSVAEYYTLASPSFPDKSVPGHASSDFNGIATSRLFAPSGPVPPSTSLSSQREASYEHNVHSSGAISSSTLYSTASYSSYASNAEDSDCLLTPQTSFFPQAWNGVNSSNPCATTYPSPWTSTSEQWQNWPKLQGLDTAGVVGETDPLGEESGLYAAYLNDEAMLFEKRGSMPGSDIMISSNFTARQLAWSRNPSRSSGSSLSVDTSSTQSDALLPPACIVGNVPGWQSSSPTYPSMLDFEDATLLSKRSEFRTEPVIVHPTSFAGEISKQIDISLETHYCMTNSSGQVHNRQPRELFNFSPVDYSKPSAPPDEEICPMEIVPSNHRLATVRKPSLPGRRASSTLTVRIPALDTRRVRSASDGLVAQPTSAPASAIPLSAPVLPVIPVACVAAPARSAPIPYPLPVIAHDFAYDTPKGHGIALSLNSPQSASTPPSCLQPAPGNIHVAPPLSRDRYLSRNDAHRATIALHASRAQKAARNLPMGTPVSFPAGKGLVYGPSDMRLPLPVQGQQSHYGVLRPTKITQQSKRKTARFTPPRAIVDIVAQGRTSTQGEIGQCLSFVNYTPADAVEIQSAVCVSGPRPKRKHADASSSRDTRQRRH